jgi:predicted dehydrogenase
MALKVGVVGMSEIGNIHANCHANDDLAELVAVCDIMKERADTAAERLGVKAYYKERLGVKAYYSLADMIDGEPDLDIVDVGTGGNENGSWH